MVIYIANILCFSGAEGDCESNQTVQADTGGNGGEETVPVGPHHTM